jgi:ADP-ribosylglycohydrolase
MKERYIATLIGTALGDTLGMPVETWPKERIQFYMRKYLGLDKVTEPMTHIVPHEDYYAMGGRDQFGKLHSFMRDYDKGEYTDDTILTLAIAESVVEKGGIDLPHIAAKHVEALDEYTQQDGTIKGGFGKTTMQALFNLRDGKSHLESAVSTAPGNGPAMKMAPVGLYVDATSDYEKGMKYAKQIGQMTHLDSRSVVSGIVQAHNVVMLLRDMPRGPFLDSMYQTSIKYETSLGVDLASHPKDSFTEKVTWILDNRDVADEQAFQTLGNTGQAYKSVPFAYFMAQKYLFSEKPLEGLIETVNWGGDADTTGAIYGALMGAKHGMVFPEKWLSILQGKDRLIKAGEGIYALREKEGREVFSGTGTGIGI